MARGWPPRHALLLRLALLPESPAHRATLRVQGPGQKARGSSRGGRNKAWALAGTAVIERRPAGRPALGGRDTGRTTRFNRASPVGLRAPGRFKGSQLKRAPRGAKPGDGRPGHGAPHRSGGDPPALPCRPVAKRGGAQHSHSGAPGGADTRRRVSTSATQSGLSGLRGMADGRPDDRSPAAVQRSGGSAGNHSNCCACGAFRAVCWPCHILPRPGCSAGSMMAVTLLVTVLVALARNWNRHRSLTGTSAQVALERCAGKLAVEGISGENRVVNGGGDASLSCTLQTVSEWGVVGWNQVLKLAVRRTLRTSGLLQPAAAPILAGSGTLTAHCSGGTLQGGRISTRWTALVVLLHVWRQQGLTQLSSAEGLCQVACA